MRTFLEFEKPIAELEAKIDELRHLSSTSELNIVDEIGRLQAKLESLLKQTYGKLTPWQKAQVARHVERPHAADYIAGLIEEFTPLAGDRSFADDPAIIAGLGRLRGRALMLIGQEKGHDTQSRLRHNFGMARPEGYRKADRLMRLAQRFRLPVLTLIDTPGAYPGVDAEARGQAAAIAQCIETSLTLTVPIVAVIIGEGGSGGAMALATADRVLILEHAIYSVISPEGCASILWRGAEHAQAAAEALRLTAQDLKRLNIVDAVIAEPLGGAHRDPQAMVNAVGAAVAAAFAELPADNGPGLRQRRRQRFLDMAGDG